MLDYLLEEGEIIFDKHHILYHTHGIILPGDAKLFISHIFGKWTQPNEIVIT